MRAVIPNQDTETTVEDGVYVYQLQFDLTGYYEFGVSRYEIKGGKRDEKMSQPLYECGDINETITLVFEK